VLVGYQSRGRSCQAAPFDRIAFVDFNMLEGRGLPYPPHGCFAQAKARAKCSRAVLIGVHASMNACTVPSPRGRTLNRFLHSPRPDNYVERREMADG